MTKRYIEVDDDRWFVRLSEYSPHPQVGTVIFFPRNDQRPYRVVEVAIDTFGSQGELEKLSDAELLELYRHGDALDFAHESKATLSHPTHMARPLPPGVGFDA